MGFTVDVKLDTSGIKQLEKSLKGITKKHIKFGWIDGKSYPSGHPSAGLKIAQVASYHEFGVKASADKPAIPQRPYFRQTIQKARYNYNGEIGEIFNDVVHSRNSITALNKLATTLSKQYSISVARQNFDSLSEKTIKIKGHNYQMVHSSIMINSFQAKVYRTSLNSVKG